MIEMTSSDVTLHDFRPVLAERNAEAFVFFERAAENVVRSFTPSRVLVVGRWAGLLIEALWDRGVEASGVVGGGEYLQNVRLDVRPFCSATVCENSQPELVIWLEANLLASGVLSSDVVGILRRANRFLFAPIFGSDAEIAAPLKLVQELAKESYYPVLTYDAGYLGVGAFLFERTSDMHVDHIDLARQLNLVDRSRRQEMLVKQLNVVLTKEADASARIEVMRAASEREVASLTERCQSLERELAIVEHNLSNVLNSATLTAASLRSQCLTQNEDAELHLGLEELVQRTVKAERDLDVAMAQLRAMQSSTCWRMTAPIRVLGTRWPNLKLIARNMIKLIYWTVTFQLPARLKRRREFRRQLKR